VKRILSAIFVVALLCTMLSACATQSDIQKLQAGQDQIMQRLTTLEQSQADNAQAVKRAEAAADRAEAMAAKTESLFYKHMKK